MRFRFMGLLALLCLLPTFANAAERNLYWKSLEVNARLDAEGRLHVSERHHMVFTGNWNGGERTFRVEEGQVFDFHAMKRFDPQTGASWKMNEGVLTLVDNYGFRDGTALRWRSRKPTDPPFDDTLIGYDLSYTLSNILILQDDGSYLLNHDFAFPNRRWPIKSFVLRLDIDPAWQSEPSLAGEYRQAPLNPGESLILKQALRYTGAGRPDSVAHGISQTFAWLLLTAFMGAFGFFGMEFYRREKTLGRFKPLKNIREIDHAWLEAHLFCHLPEVVAAAWDERIDSQEVATVIARMAVEEKVRGEVRSGTGTMKGKPVLHLRLLVERESLNGYEAKLAKALFFSDGTTDTERLRARYKNFGFDPVSRVHNELLKRVGRLAPARNDAESGGWRNGFFLFLGAAAISILGIVLGTSGNMEFAAIQNGYLLAIWLLGLLAAMAYSKRVTALDVPLFFLSVLVIIAVIGLSMRIFFAPSHIHQLVLVGHTFLAALVLRNWFRVAHYNQGDERFLLRRRLLSARQYFKSELKKEKPALVDAWYPYLVAFGLAKELNRWFRSYGAAFSNQKDDASDDLLPAGSMSRGNMNRNSTWTGGGGACGGAGASGTWAAAAVSLGAGVSIPSTR